MLIEFTDKGLFCPLGNFYIDSWLPVDKAVITHAHSDHAHPCNKYYLCQILTKPLLHARLGDKVYETLEWNKSININGVNISLHPAGHIIGSSQIRIEYKGEVWVASGDYKTEDDHVLRSAITHTGKVYCLPLKQRTQKKFLLHMASN